MDGERYVNDSSLSESTTVAAAPVRPQAGAAFAGDLGTRAASRGFAEESGPSSMVGQPLVLGGASSRPLPGSATSSLLVGSALLVLPPIFGIIEFFNEGSDLRSIANDFPGVLFYFVTVALLAVTTLGLYRQRPLGRELGLFLLLPLTFSLVIDFFQSIFNWAAGVGLSSSLGGSPTWAFFAQLSTIVLVVRR